MKKESMGMIIQAKRKELGMTQQDLADKMCVTDKAVSKWERDLAYPDVKSLPKLAEALGMSVDELMQIKTEAQTSDEKMSVKAIVSLVLKAVTLASGVAVVALSALGEMTNDLGFTLLGIGLACAGITLLEKK